MHPDNLERLQQQLTSQGLEAALLSSPFTLTWLTGYAPPIQTGPSPFEGGPALGWFRAGALTLITSDAEAGAARAAGVEARDYPGFTLDQPLAVVERQAAALSAALVEGGRLRGPVGVELNFLPAPLLEAARSALPDSSLRSVDTPLAQLRAVKTADEIGKIRAALALCDQAQADVGAHVRPGVAELELWGGMKGRLESAAGTRLPILADLVAGARTGDIGGLPGDYALRPGDAVIFDVVPRLDGYWGDNCATYFAGERPAELSRAYSVVRDALNRTIDAVRPGARADELDALARGLIRDAGYPPYPHHTGHGLGAAYHEEPRLVPYNTAALEPGMVIALEPGVYLPGIGGVRLEHVVLVTGDGCQVLTHHLDED